LCKLAAGLLTGQRPALTINALVNSQKGITAVFAALADPTRRRILRGLSGGEERPVAELAKPFRISAPAISRHLRVLERARLIERRRAGRMHYIRPRSEGLDPARQWMAQCAAGWGFSFDALDELLRNECAKEKKP
jgi:DNA-binding transcriptional ArsR family regulator